MTTIRHSAPVASSQLAPTPDSARATSSAGGSALLLAPAPRPTTTTGTRDVASDPIASRNAHTEAARAVHAALGGDPSALIAMVTLRMRDSKTGVRMGDANANAATARQALADERAAHAAAETAVRKAAEAADASGLFSSIAKIAAVVVGVAVTVCSAGGGAVVLAGALMLAFGDELVAGLVEAGVVPPEMAESVSLALKITGTIMMGPGALAGGLSVAGAVVSTYGDDLVKVLADAGVDEDFCEGLGVSLAVVGTALSIAGGAAGDGAKGITDGAAKTAIGVAKATGQIVNGGATIGAASMEIVSANHVRSSENSQADATEHRADADMAQEEIGTITDAVRDDFKRAAKMLRLARQIGEAHNQSMQAASGARA